jgi:hypothetical protein
MAADTDRGVRFPEVGGDRSTTVTGRAILADAAAATDPGLAARIADARRWRRDYVPQLRALTRAAGASRQDALAIASAGLDSMRRRMAFVRGGADRPLADALAGAPSPVPPTSTVVGASAPARELVVPHRGGELRGDALREQLDRWVHADVVEPSFARAIGRVIDHPEWLALRGRRVAVIGAASEMGPLPALAAWGAHVLAIDLPRAAPQARVAEVARAGAGTVNAVGLDLERDAAAALAWIEDHAGADRLVLGMYAYANGGGHVQVTAAADLLATRLLEERPGTALAFLATPTDTFLVGPEIVARAREKWDDRRVRAWAQGPLRAASRGGLFAPSYEDAGDGWGVADALIPQQGPNYALAKRLQRWRGVLAREAGHPVSFNVAPATWTRSVTQNRVLAAAYAGAHRFGIEIFDAPTTRTLMAALLVHDLEHEGAQAADAHPEALFTEGAAHGGLWRAAYEPRSVLGIAALAGLPGVLRP